MNNRRAQKIDFAYRVLQFTGKYPHMTFNFKSGILFRFMLVSVMQSLPEQEKQNNNLSVQFGIHIVCHDSD